MDARIHNPDRSQDACQVKSRTVPRILPRAFPLSHERFVLALGGAMLAAVLLQAPSAQAQVGDMLKKGADALGGGAQGGAGQSGQPAQGGGALGNLGGMLPANVGTAVGSSSSGNVAGLLQFCAKNNYLGGGDASSVQNSLMSKLGGQQKAQSDSGFLSGAKGIIDGGKGQTVDLNSAGSADSGGGMKEQLTRKICDQVLSRGKSLL